MSKVIVGTVIIFLGLMICYWLRKKNNKKRIGRLERVLGESDYQRLAIASFEKCLDCGGCAMDSKGCCSNCVKSVNSSENNNSTEAHCQGHNHEHKHHNHSN
ncbi:14761_t:CDS:1 [Funneliformis geosporum]|uniref:14761_t:CDS:1 n=1 Tax=Funneliformis geosporum TaxID=1117311 RepID=A0A9W4WWL9_9GLOM|nr:14761_t:CDS:1 [Funneliformis geosporum]